MPVLAQEKRRKERREGIEVWYCRADLELGVERREQKVKRLSQMGRKFKQEGLTEQRNRTGGLNESLYIPERV